MKIAVSTDDGTTICSHLGRCESFLVFDVEAEEIRSRELRTNSFTSHSQGHCSHDHRPGMGAHSHDGIIQGLSDCKVVISRGMGWRVAEDLREANITPVVTEVESAEVAVKAYLEGKLRISEEGICGPNEGS